MNGNLKIFKFAGVVDGWYTDNYAEDLCVIAATKEEAIQSVLLRGDLSQDEIEKLHEATVATIEIVDRLMFRLFKNTIEFEYYEPLACEGEIYEIPAQFLTTAYQVGVYAEMAKTATTIDWSNVRFVSDEALKEAAKRWGELANINMDDRRGDGKFVRAYEFAVEAFKNA